MWFYLIIGLFISNCQSVNMVRDKLMTAFKLKLPAKQDRKTTTQLPKIDDESTTSDSSDYDEMVGPGLLESETEDPLYTKLCAKPTAMMTTDELIKLHGREAEIHVVQTEDGYVHKLHRVLVPAAILSKKKTVILQHGLLGSSADWVLLGKHKSLPYLLSDAGYDVWLLNARGNYYSTHNNLTLKSPLYWNFTLHEIGQRDIKAAIEYINLRKKNEGKMFFIAHSTGASSLLVLLTSFPKYNDYLQMGVLLAPLAFMSETKGPLELLGRVNSSVVLHFVNGSGMVEFYPKRVPVILAVVFCKGSLLFCRNPLFFMVGCLQSTPLDDEMFYAQLSCHVPAGSSTRSIMHLTQLVHTGRFHPYNAPNQEYQLQRVSLPLAIFSSSDDMISTVTDGARIFVNVKNPIEHVVLNKKKISHTEFVWGAVAPELIFRKILVLFGSNVTVISKNEV